MHDDTARRLDATCSRRGRVVTSVIVVLLVLLSPTPAGARSPASFPELTADQRIYDATGTSLTEAQVADLQQRLRELQAAGADPVLYVRALDATAEETLDEVEALQQAWAGQTGAAQDTAVAVLVNRNPDDLRDARAGVFVGSTFQEGNVPEDEQRAIVEEALIPPLRDGDVHASLAAAVDRLTRSIREGPPRNAFEQWAEGAAGSWLPEAAVVVALVALGAAVAVFRRRSTSDRRPQPPTTVRPGQVSPALAGALVAGSPQASAVPATLLDLARRDALAVEPEREDGILREPTVQVRLLDGGAVDGEVEEALWAALEQRADGGVVAGEEIKELAGSPGPVVDAVERRMRTQGWLDPNARRSRAALGGIAAVAFALAVFALVAAAAGGSWWPMALGIVALGGLSVVALAFAGAYSRLSSAGQAAAVPWKAYRDGLERALTGDALDLGLDLDAALPDLVAVGLGGKVKDRLEAASSSEQTLRAFDSTTGSEQQTLAAYIPIWVAFTSTTSATTGATGTVSGGGAGGGGGAAGST